MEPLAPYDPNQDEKTTAMLAHVLQIFTWFLGPSVIFFTKRNSGFVRFHSLQALAFQGAWIVAGAVVAVLAIAVVVLDLATGDGNLQPTAFLLVFSMLFLFGGLFQISTLVVRIVYGIKAVNGKWSDYPIIGRWARRWARIAPPPITTIAP